MTHVRPLPSLNSVADQIFKEISRSGKATDDELSSLHFLFDKHFEKAVQIVDQGGVYSFKGRVSGRKVFQVQGHRPSDRYTVFPRHYCTCHSFHFDVVSKGEAVFCKHQLAVLLAEALKRTKQTETNDLVVAELLEGA